MKFTHLLLVAFLSVVAASFTASYTVRTFAPPPGNAAPVLKESALDRVKRTGVLRCAYYVFPPVILRDPATGALSGLGVDMTGRLLQGTGIKVEWTEEIDFANWQPGLKAGRFDAICTPMWPEAALAREALFTRPMFYSGIYVYARGDDHRFDDNLAAVNDPAVTIAIIEGNGTDTLAERLFPQAKLLKLPSNSPGGLPAENVITRKADVTLWDENGVHDLLASRPGSIRNVDPSHPVKVMPFELVTNLGEESLRDFLDVGLQSLEDTGATRQILDKWERAPGDFLRMAKPYAVPEGGKP
jgi:ABC-type amino acid transport substrate-binding protein